MMYVYFVKYLPATDTKGAMLKVTRADDEKSKIVPVNYDDSSAASAIERVFKVPPGSLHYVGAVKSLGSVYACDI